MPGLTRTFWLTFVTVWLLLAAPLAIAQTSRVEMNVDPDAVGLAGTIRPGVWTPIKLTLQSRAADNRPVICRWLLRDSDGDQLYAQRRVTLNPNRQQQVWLYGPPPATAGARAQWTLQVLDAESLELLAQQEVAAPQQLTPDSAAMAVLSTRDLGLEPFTRPHTQHERIEMLRGLTLEALPDRWYGLSLVEGIIWTSTGGDPTDPAFTADIQQALREWVRRGGHLVIVLPVIGYQSWTATAGVAELLPVGAEQMRRVDDFSPTELGTPETDELVPVSAIVFDADQDADVTVLAEDDLGRAYVVAHRYGFGRVTLVGTDLSGRVADLGLPNGQKRIWHTIFNWQAPALNQAYIEDEIKEQRMARPESRDKVLLGRFIPSLIAMRNTAAPALLAAIVIFGLYWLLAGPVAFVVLRQRHAVRYSWLAFVAVVAVFTAITWGGALLLQPRLATVAHFSVVDVDGNSNQATAHTHSWLSLFVPTFDEVEVAIEPDEEANHNTLASPGLLTGPEATGFPDQRTWTLDAAAPYRAELPFRATAKQLEIDYYGQLGVEQAGLPEPWAMPQGRLHIDNFWPTGRLSHGLPGTLENVLMVYCPGGDQQPWVWRYGDWPANQVIELRAPREMDPPRPADRLVVAPRRYDAERQWGAEGFLGKLIDRKTGHLDPLQVAIADDVTVRLVEMLSFHAALPPPNFRRVDFMNPPASYQRDLGRSLDITDLTAGRRLILIGHLRQSPLPVPMTVDGEPVDAEGWTVVRWVYDLSSEKAEKRNMKKRPTQPQRPPWPRTAPAAAGSEFPFFRFSAFPLSRSAAPCP